MRILFIHFGREHLGIEYISSVLKNSGHEVFLAHDPGLFSPEDNVFAQPLLEKFFSRRQNILRKIEKSDPDLIAFSVYTSTYPWACTFAKEIKEKFGLPILFGGIHPTLVPEEVISNDFVDYLISGEGEYAMLELLQSLEGGSGLSTIKNLWYKEGRSIMQNDIRPPLKDLDRLPFPDKGLFGEAIRYKDDYMIMVGRGCPYQCSYCCESYLDKMYGNKYYRIRGVASVIEELKQAKARYQIREVMFFDAIFFLKKSWLETFLTRYEKEIGIPFRCTGHVNFLDEDVARLMKNAGCYCIDFGIQTFNEDARKRLLNRFESNEQIEKALKICDDYNISYDIDLILGLPEATEDDYKLPLKALKRTKSLNRIKCYYLTYYPKLLITDKSKNLNFLDEKDILNIAKGNAGDWFHRDFSRNAIQRKLNIVYGKIYKIYPLLPVFLKDAICKKQLIRFFYFIPGFVVVLLQGLQGIKMRDRRFFIYINNYLNHFKIILLGRT